MQLKSSRVSITTFGAHENEFLRKLMHAYKYEGLPEAQEIMARTFSTGLIKIGHGKFSNQPLVIPMPLHPLKERLRGFNQSIPLAHAAATHFRAPIATAILNKKWMRRPQATMQSAEDRKKNIRGTFAINNVNQHAIKILQDRHVILIDDVVTTGATIAEAAALLTAYGAKKISAFAFLKG